MIHRHCAIGKLYITILNFDFRGSLKSAGWLVDKLETCGVYRAAIPLPFMQILDLYTVPTRLYGSLNIKNLVNYAAY